MYAKPYDTFGLPIAVNPRQVVLQDATMPVDPNSAFYAGNVVTLGSNGVKLIDSTDKVPFGIAKVNHASFQPYGDETRSTSISGSGKVTVIINGIV